MALTGHHSVNTVLGYYRADTALQNAQQVLDAEVPSKKASRRIALEIRQRGH